LEAKSLRSRQQEIPHLLRVYFLAQRWHILAVFSYGKVGSLHSNDLITSIRSYLLLPSKTLEIRISMYEFGGRGETSIQSIEHL
jgi:hypothetical protein